jgi:hypothetical protein
VAAKGVTESPAVVRRRILRDIRRVGRRVDRHDALAGSGRGELDDLYVEGYEAGIILKDMAEARGLSGEAVKLRLKAKGIAVDLRRLGSPRYAER